MRIIGTLEKTREKRWFFIPGSIFKRAREETDLNWFGLNAIENSIKELYCYDLWSNDHLSVFFFTKKNRPLGDALIDLSSFFSLLPIFCSPICLHYRLVIITYLILYQALLRSIVAFKKATIILILNLEPRLPGL